MSTSDLYRIYRTKATHIADYRNGHGTAPLIWGYLSERYLGGSRYGYSLQKDLDPLWKLSKDQRVPRSVRIAHAFTFDQAVCPIAKIGELAEALDEAGKICACDQHVNHWPSIASDLRSHKARARQIGVALSCTSVSDAWIDWKGDPEAWDLFAALGDSEGKSASEVK